jgi:hypothetical protein
MRMDSFTQRCSVLSALVLAGALGITACNEADGTDPWPGAYPPESEIDRPKGGDAGAKDSGARDAGGGDGEMLDAAAEDSGEPEAGDGDGSTPEAGAGDGGRSDAAS